jgi:hypothetical protein
MVKTSSVIKNTYKTPMITIICCVKDWMLSLLNSRKKQGGPFSPNLFNTLLKTLANTTIQEYKNV